MVQKKLKILVLSHCDIPLRGHALSIVESLPKNKYDVRFVVLDKLYGDGDYQYFYNLRNKWKRRVVWRLRNYIQKIKVWTYCRTKLKLRPNTEGRAFFIGDFNPITGSEIIAKNPGFKPDLILMAWTRTFVSSKAVRQMYDLTHAKFLFFFVDDAHLSGGCHFPVDCDGYQHGCHDCPVIIRGKRLAEKVMADKIKYYAGIPKFVVGVPSDCRLAKKSLVLGDAIKFYHWVSDPAVEITLKAEARQSFGIPDNAFVAMTGANYITDLRKGFKYAVEAVNKLAERYDNIYFMLLGNQAKKEVIFDVHPKAKLITLGFLDIHGLFRAFCAADCFLNMTIADSGPMMVNYSMNTGTPVVSFYIGIAQDLVEHQKTGYIAKYKDSEDVALGMEFILNLSPEVRQQMTEDCKQQIDKVRPKINWVDDIYDNWNAFDKM